MYKSKQTWRQNNRGANRHKAINRDRPEKPRRVYSWGDYKQETGDQNEAQLKHEEIN